MRNSGTMRRSPSTRSNSNKEVEQDDIMFMKRDTDPKDLRASKSEPNLASHEYIVKPFDIALQYIWNNCNHMSIEQAKLYAWIRNIVLIHYPELMDHLRHDSTIDAEILTHMCTENAKGMELVTNYQIDLANEKAPDHIRRKGVITCTIPKKEDYMHISRVLIPHAEYCPGVTYGQIANVVLYLLPYCALGRVLGNVDLTMPFKNAQFVILGKTAIPINVLEDAMEFAIIPFTDDALIDLASHCICTMDDRIEYTANVDDLPNIRVSPKLTSFVKAYQDKFKRTEYWMPREVPNGYWAALLALKYNIAPKRSAHLFAYWYFVCFMLGVMEGTNAWKKSKFISNIAVESPGNLDMYVKTVRLAAKYSKDLNDEINSKTKYTHDVLLTNDEL